MSGYLYSFQKFVFESENFIEKFYDENYPIIALPYVLDMSDPTDSGFIKNEDWGPAEEWGCRTNGESPELLFKLKEIPASRKVAIEFEITEFDLLDQSSRVDLFINGVFAESWTPSDFTDEEKSVLYQLSGDELILHFSWKVTGARQRKDRDLAIGFKSVSIAEG